MRPYSAVHRSVEVFVHRITPVALSTIQMVSWSLIPLAASPPIHTLPLDLVYAAADPCISIRGVDPYRLAVLQNLDAHPQLMQMGSSKNIADELGMKKMLI